MVGEKHFHTDEDKYQSRHVIQLRKIILESGMLTRLPEVSKLLKCRLQQLLHPGLDCSQELALPNHLLTDMIKQKIPPRAMNQLQRNQQAIRLRELMN